MRPWLDWKTWIGSLAVLGTVLMLSPGVQLVQASSDADLAYLNAARPGPTCEAGGATPDLAARKAARIRNAKLRQLSHAPPQPA